jgi:hypothetical protein
MFISRTKSFGAGSPQGNTPPPRPTTPSRWAKRKSQEPGNSGRCALRTPSASSCGLRSSIVVGWWSIVGDMASRITALVRCAANPYPPSPPPVCVRKRGLVQDLSALWVDTLSSWWLTRRKSVHKLRRCAFDPLVLLPAWTIWNHRNGKVFRNVFMQPSA